MQTRLSAAVFIKDMLPATTCNFLNSARDYMTVRSKLACAILILGLTCGVSSADDFYPISESEWREVLADMGSVSSISYLDIVNKQTNMSSRATSLLNAGNRAEGLRLSFIAFVLGELGRSMFSDDVPAMTKLEHQQAVDGMKEVLSSVGMTEAVYAASYQNLHAMLNASGRVRVIDHWANLLSEFARSQPPKYARGALTGFRSADWGMNRSIVIDAEGVHDSSDEDSGALFYNRIDLLGFSVTAVFFFETGCTSLKGDANCLFKEGRYAFDDWSERAFRNIEAKLTERYGPPTGIRYLDGYFNRVNRTSANLDSVWVERVFENQTRLSHGIRKTIVDKGKVTHLLDYEGPSVLTVEAQKEKAKQREF